jgi:serine-type D-Ala-D-Ala carboxypeptidase
LLSALVAALAFVLPSDGLPAKSPTAVGMSAKRLESIERVVARGIRAGGYPGAAVVVGRQGYAVYERGFGKLGWTGDSPRVSADRTIYDLASVTKVVGTTTAIMLLYDQGKIKLDERAVEYLPEFYGGGREEITVRQLLEHRSGLPAGRELWRIATSPDQARAALLATPLECSPGSCYIYSDIGADILGMIAERVSGQPLDQFLAERVFGPLGMNDTFFRPADSLRYRVAPTEVTPPRGYPLRGEVHDENAYALGGVAGHAGLFSTAADLSVFAQMMLNGGEYNGVRILSDSVVAIFTKRAAGTRALGWDTCDGHGGCGQYLSSRAFGHTGFTGTSLWIDPDREMFVILLTNRVHAARARRPAKVISDVRADLADAAAAAVMAFRADRAIGWNTVERSIRRSRSGRRSTSARSRAAAAARRSNARKAAAASGKSSAKSAKSAKSSSGSVRRKSASAHNASKLKSGKGGKSATSAKAKKAAAKGGTSGTKPKAKKRR